MKCMMKEAQEVLFLKIKYAHVWILGTSSQSPPAVGPTWRAQCSLGQCSYRSGRAYTETGKHMHYLTQSKMHGDYNLPVKPQAAMPSHALLCNHQNHLGLQSLSSFLSSPFHHFFPLFGKVNPRPKLPGVRTVCADGGLWSVEHLYVLEHLPYQVSFTDFHFLATAFLQHKHIFFFWRQLFILVQVLNQHQADQETCSMTSSRSVPLAAQLKPQQTTNVLSFKPEINNRNAINSHGLLFTHTSSADQVL